MPENEDYRGMLEDGLKQVEIGKRMVKFAKAKLDMDAEEKELKEEAKDAGKPKKKSKRGDILQIISKSK